MYNGTAFLLDEAGMTRHSHRRSIFTCRTMTALMHITAFLIISFNRETITYSIPNLIIAAAGLIVILAGQYIEDKVYKDGCPLGMELCHISFGYGSYNACKAQLLIGGKTAYMDSNRIFRYYVDTCFCKDCA